MRMRRKSATVAVAVAMIAGMGGTGGAMAADGDDSPEVVVIGDRTFGPEDGLVVESGEVTLARGRSRTATPMSPEVFSRGTSYASTNHPTPITYVGKSRAMANIYSSLRVIRASFKYTRDGNDVISWQNSNASVSSSCTWSAGAVKSHTVYDNLLPGTPITRFRYDFVSISPAVC